MAKRVQLPVVGGLRKSILIDSSPTNLGTTIEGFANQTLTLAQLQALLGVQSTKPNTVGGGTGGAPASITLGQGLQGGGPLLGNVPISLTRPSPAVFWDDSLLPDDFVGGASSGGSGGSSTLSGLSDVTIASPSTGQVLAFNGTKWANASVPGTTRIVNKGANWVSSTAIVAGSANIVYVNCPMAGTIQGVRVVTSGGPGSCVLDVWKVAFGSFPPLVANSITASAKPTISAAITYNDVTLTGWTTAITAGDVLAFALVSCSSFTQIEIVLQVAQ